MYVESDTELLLVSTTDELINGLYNVPLSDVFLSEDRETNTMHPFFKCPYNDYTGRWPNLESHFVPWFDGVCVAITTVVIAYRDSIV